MAKNYFQERLNKLLEKMGEKEAFLVTLPEEIYYFTGFTGEDSYLIIKKSEISLFTDLRFTEQVKREKKIDLNIYEVTSQNKVITHIKDNLKKDNIETLLISKKDINFHSGESLQLLLLENLIELKDSNYVKKMREIKDEYEIEIIKQNLMLTELSYNLILPFVEEGRTELEVAGELEYFLRKNGSESMAFETIVASGERSVLPHGRATEKVIRKEEIILFDYGIKKNRYCSDFTRCYYFGKIISDEILRIHGVVEKALKAAENAVRAGISAKDIHRVAWNIIDREGYSSNFWHSTGHGVGLEIHEAPSISERSDTILEEGMVFSVEPGIYVPGVGGIRLEDIVVVRKDGAEVLTTTEYEL